MSKVVSTTSISCARAKALIKKYPSVYGTTLSSADRSAVDAGTACLSLVSYVDGTRDVVIAKAPSPKKTKQVEPSVVEPVIEETEAYEPEVKDITIEES